MSDTQAAPDAGEESERADVDLLLFEVGDVVYGTDASSVLRIGMASLEGAFALPELGPLDHGKRSLVFRGSDDAEVQLRVDVVRGVKTVSGNALRKMPGPAAVRSYAQGIWLDGDRPVLLIDLPESSKFHAV